MHRRTLIRQTLAIAALAAPATAQYQLVWEDDFGGTALDLSKWEPMIGDGCPNLCGWGNNELEYYRAENATVNGGMLRITALEESFGGRDYTSARLRTRGLGDWLYGRFEMRARLPEGQGLWPAFWMLPTDGAYGTWAASGEIDIVEAVGQDPARVFGTLHYGGTFPSNVQSGGATTATGASFSEAFHRFAIEWDPTEIRWYVDDVLYSTKTSWFSTGGPYPAPFDEPFHLLLNVAVGGNLPGSPDASTVFPQTLEVDWVRVFQRPDHDPDDCRCLFDDMEHADPAANGWFEFDGPIVGGSILADPSDSPPGVIGGTSLSAGWGGLFSTPGFFGGFGRTRPMDLSSSTHLEFWIHPDPGQDFVIEINLQDDDDGDDEIPNVPDGGDDEFQYDLTVGPPGSEVASDGGWQKVSIPLADFVDDNSVHFGGNGLFDPTPIGAGGNGQLINVVFSLVNVNGTQTTFRTDDWAFVQRAASISGRVWADENGDGADLLEAGLADVRLELVESGSGIAQASTASDASGAYAFEGLPEGSYEVRVDATTLPGGAVATFDPDGLSTVGRFSVELDCGQLTSGRSFGYDAPFLGSRLCSPATANSTGSSGSLTATGSLLASSNDLTLLGSSLPAQQAGYFITSRTPGALANPGGSQGTLCVIGSIGRYRGPGQVVVSDLLGTVSLPVDLAQTPTPTGFVTVQAGQTWVFQYWHRDANPTPTSNFTDAVAITFQ